MCNMYIYIYNIYIYMEESWQEPKKTWSSEPQKRTSHHHCHAVRSTHYIVLSRT